MHLIVFILTTIAAFSLNIRIMGRPNIALLGEETILILRLLKTLLGSVFILSLLLLVEDYLIFKLLISTL